MSFFQKLLAYTLLLFVAIAGCIFLTDKVGLRIGNRWHIADLFSFSGLVTIVFIAAFLALITKD